MRELNMAPFGVVGDNVFLQTTPGTMACALKTGQ